MSVPEPSVQNDTKIGKSTCVFQINQKDASYDLELIETKIRQISIDGLLWGKSEQDNLFYGLKCLKIGAVITDEVGISDIKKAIKSKVEAPIGVKLIAFQKI